MFETLLNADVQFAGLNVIVWTVTAVLMSRRPVERSARRGKARAVTLTVLLLLGCLMAVGRVAVVVLMGRESWLFVSDRAAVALPLLLVPAVCALVWALPLLRAWSRGPSLAARTAAFTPKAVVPFQIAAVASAVGFWTCLFQVVSRPLLGPALAYDLPVAALAALAWWWQGTRWRWAARPEAAPRRRSGPVRALRAVAVVAVLAVVCGGVTVMAKNISEVPGDMAMSAGTGMSGHGAAPHHGSGTGSGMTSVTALTGPRDERPDVRYTLVADEKTVHLASGRTVHAWAFNGQVPGPALHVRRGQLVEVKLVNHLDKASVSLHWHGVDVPNAEDGVPGVTQNAVKPGGSHTYRFRPDESGTHWYHSHSQASLQVTKGLFGPLILDPAKPAPVDHDWYFASHSWTTTQGADVAALGLSDRLERRKAKPGSKVRLRLLNSDQITHRFSLTGTRFRVTALDGNAVHEPGPVGGKQLVLGVGARYDLEFTMPDHPVRLTEVQDFVGALDSGVLISADGTGTVKPDIPADDFDPTTYGTPAKTPFGPDSDFDRTYSWVLDNEIGFYDGKWGFTWSVNGKVFPDVDPITVAEGDLVKVTFANRSHYDHPMHLHGHHVLVLSRNGKRATGSPVWLDTVNVGVGEVWTVAFRADNPGMWMDHCHIGHHANLGMMTHLVYENVTSPYHMGPDTGNVPE